MTITEWLVAIAAVAAVIVSVVALIYSRSSARSAKRSAIAAEESADAAKRTADVAERDERRKLEDAEQRAVRWEVERLGSAFVKLWNTGDSTAHDVYAEASESVRIVSQTPPVQGDTIHAGTGVRIGASSYDGDDGHLTIRWRNQPDGEVKELIYRL